MKYIKKFNESYSNSEFHKEIAEILKKECRPFIELSKSCNIELWRGVTHKFIDKHSTEISKLAYRVKHKDRKPIDTPSELHDRLNLAFIEKFGWPVRDGWEYVLENYKDYTIYAWCKDSSLPLLIEKGFETGEIVTYVEKKI